MPTWTTADLPPLAGKVAIVTGATSGIGLEAAAGLAAAGAETVLGCRNQARADKAIAEIRSRAPQAKVHNILLDTSELSSVRAFAKTFADSHQRLDILVNNAGTMTVPFSKTADGFEIVFGTNYLGPFALTGLLLDTIRSTPGARVVAIGSQTHRRAKLVLDDLLWERRPYSKGGAYAQSKLACMMYSFELDRRFKAAGIDAKGVVADPGYAATNIVFGGSQGASSALWSAMASMGNTLFAQGADKGALPTLYAAADPGIKGGEYIAPDGFMQLKGYPTVATPAAKARDVEMAKRLWEVSEQLTGVRYL